MSIRRLHRAPLYSEELGIALGTASDAEYFKWFLASVLFGARISETIARNTYRAFERHRLLTPRRILAAGWNTLVDPVMREGGYVRYDGRKSTQVLRDCAQLLDAYAGRLSRVDAASRDSADLEAHIQEFYGVGPVTANIFLRELRPFWKHADQEPLPVVFELAGRCGIDLGRYDRKTQRFVRLEAALIRERHTARRA